MKEPQDTTIRDSQDKWLDILQELDVDRPILVQTDLRGPWKERPVNGNGQYVTRGILNCEIVLDFDHPSPEDRDIELKRLEQYLKGLGWPYYMATTGGKGIHVHIFLDTSSLNDSNHMKDRKQRIEESGKKVDLYRMLRTYVGDRICKEAGLTVTQRIADGIDKRGIDRQKYTFSTDNMGSQIRMVGCLRENGRTKQLIDSKGEPLPIPDRPPKVVDLTIWSRDIEHYIDGQLTRLEAMGDVPIVFDGLDGMDCVRQLEAHGAPVGLRNSMALPFAVLLRASGLSEQLALTHMDLYSINCPQSNKELMDANMATLKGRYRVDLEQDAVRVSCLKIRKEMGGGFCDCSGCPVELSLTTEVSDDNNGMDNPEHDTEDPELTPEIRAKAEELIRNGQAMEYISSVYKTLHYGDIDLNYVFCMAVGCQSITNVQGIQPTTTGEAGQGKTSALRACCHMLPRRYFKEASFSNKALFYTEIQPGTVLFSDDTSLSDELNDLIKRTMSKFQGETEHLTVDKNRESVTLTIPPRIVFLFTSVDSQGDEQLADRQYPISIYNTPDDDDGYVRWRNKKDVSGEDDYPINESVLICRAIMADLKGHLFRVVIPFADFIDYTEKGKRRAIRYFTDFIKAVAVFHYPNRDPSLPDKDGIITITARVEDLLEAERYFSSNKDIRKLSLTKEELALWSMMASNVDGNSEILESDLYDLWKAKTGDSYSTFRRKLYGRQERQGTKGLIDKVPGITVEKRAIQTNGTKQQTRHVNVIRCTSSPNLDQFIPFYVFDREGWERHCGNGKGFLKESTSEPTDLPTVGKSEMACPVA